MTMDTPETVIPVYNANNCNGCLQDAHVHETRYDYVEANRRYFDAEAEKMEASAQKQESARRMGDVMKKRYPSLFNEETTTVLDFACGPGLISRQLAPNVKSIVGVDISQGMVNLYNRRVSEQGVSPEEMNAVCIELKGEKNELGGQKFDIVVCCASYHHFSSIGEVTKTLASYLNVGGSLLVVDILKESEKESFENFKHIIAHPCGFTKEVIHQAFSDAGLTNFGFDIVLKAKAHGTHVKFFLARGVKVIQSFE